jgi:hypothetical protein
MSYKLLGLLGLLLGAALPACAQSSANVAATPTTTAYGQDNQGSVARSQYGLCWRTGYWTPSDSLSGCDGELAPAHHKSDRNSAFSSKSRIGWPIATELTELLPPATQTGLAPGNIMKKSPSNEQKPLQSF